MTVHNFSTLNPQIQISRKGDGLSKKKKRNMCYSHKDNLGKQPQFWQTALLNVKGRVKYPIWCVCPGTVSHTKTVWPDLGVRWMWTAKKRLVLKALWEIGCWEWEGSPSFSFILNLLPMGPESGSAKRCLWFLFSALIYVIRIQIKIFVFPPLMRDSREV